MIFMILIGVGFLFYKSKNISKYNVAIYVILLGLYVSESLLGSSIKTDGQSWEWPLLVSMFQLTQVVVRVPFGKLSQKLRSRKIPMLLAMLLMLILSTPLIFEASFLTLFPAMIGLGIAGATYGMQNQYWSENSNIRSAFLSVAIIFTLPLISSFINAIITKEIPITGENFNEDYARWLMCGFITVISIVVIFYLFMKERVETIRLDNMASHSIAIKGMNLKHVLLMSLMIVFVSFATNMISIPSLINGTNEQFKMVKVAGYTLISLLGLSVAIIFIKLIKSRYIILFAHSLLIIGFIIMIIGNFGMSSFILSIIGYLMIVSGASVFTVTMIGTMLHFDHKNSLLVLGIWLSMKSASLGMGSLVGQEISIYDLNNVKYLLIVGLLLTVISLFFYILVSKKYVKPVFDMVESLEYKKYYIYSNKINIGNK